MKLKAFVDLIGKIMGLGFEAAVLAAGYRLLSFGLRGGLGDGKIGCWVLMFFLEKRICLRSKLW